MLENPATLFKPPQLLQARIYSGDHQKSDKNMKLNEVLENEFNLLGKSSTPKRYYVQIVQICSQMWNIDKKARQHA